MLLVRHGHTPVTGKTLPGRAPGVHLADEGRREAQALAAHIGRLKAVAAVYASPLERARETAAPIAEARRLTVQVEPGLTDSDSGEWTGRALRDLRKTREWRIVQQYPSGFRFPGGESLTEMQARITSTIGRLVTRHPGETVVAVSHADPIKAVVAHALGTHLDLFQRIAIAPASVTAIFYHFHGPVVLTVNFRGDGLAALTSS